jgi:hypothetical protein
MSNRKLAKAIQNLSREVQKLYRQINRATVNWLLRSAFVANRRGQSAVAGFVLPTAVLLILILTLTVGAMTLRAFDRNVQVITNAQEKVLYNAATPAIDRARSKLEFLFGKDGRYPSGTPYESRLLKMLTNNGIGLEKFTSIDPDGTVIDDPYKLPDEERVDIGSPNGPALDGIPDNAWRFRADTDGKDGPDATVVYSIIFSTPAASANANAPKPAELLLTLNDQAKANLGVVRNGPLSSQSQLVGCTSGANGTEGGLTQEAWFKDQGNTSKIRKNFQVNALVIPDNPKVAAVTMEFQQDRQIVEGNKWGAWFRYDLEIFPGPQFNWNGAMHTEGNLILGGTNFSAYLVSAPGSCLYQPESSVLSVTDQLPNAADSLGDFQGLVGMGKLANSSRGGSSTIHVQTSETAPPTQRTVDANNDAVLAGTAVIGNIASDPVSIVLEEKTQSVSGPALNNRSRSGWPNKLGAGQTGPSALKERFKNTAEKVPFVDDLYRADNRWGPKPKYNSDPGGRLPPGVAIGTEIGAGFGTISSTPAPTGRAPELIGFDGYWERRAYTEGLRLLVGERLELGNIGGWVTPRDVNRNNYIELKNNGVDVPTPSANTPLPLIGDRTATTPAQLSELEGDPLYPPTVQPYPFRTGTTLPNLTQQRRSLRDNIPAVQSAAVYHAAVGQKDYPVACMAMTVHPGTQNTLRQSINFFPTNFKNGATTNDALILSDFFNGRGTDGWEYESPGGNAAQFVAQLAPGQPLRIALDNLANFAGDPDGAFPPKQEAGLIHPYPALTMWGNYSNLKRAMTKLATGGGYNSLSIADKSYIQTAACTLGMLATNVDQLQKFDPTNPNNDVTWNNAQSAVMSDLADKLTVLMNGRVEDGEVLPKTRLSTYGYLNTGTFDQRLYNAGDYYEVPPEAFLAGIKQQVISTGGDYMNSPLIRMAELIMTSQQVRRDRTFGFRPSPAFGEYAVPFNSAVQVFPTACDPDQFALVDTAIVKVTSFPKNTPFTESRRSTSVDASGNFKPFAATYDNDPLKFPGAVAGDLGTVSGRRLALSRLCGALRIPRTYNAGGSAILDANPANRPVVLPKFPSLYYIFPEVRHGLTGAFENGPGGTDPGFADAVANRPGEWDHRQPGAISGDRAVLNPPPPAGAVPPALDAAAAEVGLNPYDREPYIIDSFINSATAAYTFRPVTAVPAPTSRQAAYPTPTAASELNPFSATLENSIRAAAPADRPSFFSRLPYANSSPFPTPDLPVSVIALAPRAMQGFPAGAAAAVLPNKIPDNTSNNTSPNRIRIPNVAAVATAPVSLTLTNAGSLPTREWAVPFLDWAMFDGRQLQVARVTDIDLGMLRSTRPAGQSDGTEFAPNETWLPLSGIVYGFREDAVREDGIARPPGGPIPAAGATNAQLILGTAMNATNPVAPFDPPVQANKGNISVKAIDYQPDPDRRVHGFRMRNGTQLKRNPIIIPEIEPAKNTRGLSFITDQPVYMFGDFNLHQEGNGDEPNRANGFLEEFLTPLPADRPYGFNEFYDRGAGGAGSRDPKFATTSQDRWRPSEILADSISILSNSYCDGSIADAFVSPSDNPRNIPDFSASNSPGDIRKSVYNQLGLYSPGCGAGDTGNTSYQNQNRVRNAPPTNANGWEWKREGASAIVPATAGNVPLSDFTTPIQISRSGEPLLIARPTNQNPTLPVKYGIGGLGLPYATPDEGRGTRQVARATDTRINATVVSGLSPSRPNQSYGGLHNFPRFVEQWNDRRFFFSGSFLQLNFSNYATGPFEQEGWEPGQIITDDEPIPHYQPPTRLWGYDVGLQFSPAGPIAARFVTPSSTRSEFYTEPPVSDPYINKLCNAVKNLPALTSLRKPGQPINCVAQNP